MQTSGTLLPSTVELLYSNHHSWLKGWLHRRLGSAEQAADIAHDTFVRLLGSERVPAAFDEPRAYLTTVAQNLVSNHWRREKLERAYLEALAQVPREVEWSPETRAMLLETLIELDRLLDGLPTIVRQAFFAFAARRTDACASGRCAGYLGAHGQTVSRESLAALLLRRPVLYRMIAA